LSRGFVTLTVFDRVRITGTVSRGPCHVATERCHGTLLPFPPRFGPLRLSRRVGTFILFRVVTSGMLYGCESMLYGCESRPFPCPKKALKTGPARGLLSGQGICTVAREASLTGPDLARETSLVRSPARPLVLTTSSRICAPLVQALAKPKGFSKRPSLGASCTDPKGTSKGILGGPFQDAFWTAPPKAPRAGPEKPPRIGQQIVYGPLRGRLHAPLSWK